MAKGKNLYKSIETFCDKKEENCNKLSKDKTIHPVTKKPLSDKNLKLFTNLCENNVKKMVRKKAGYNFEEGYQSDTLSSSFDSDSEINEAKKKADHGITRETVHNYTDNPLACTIYKKVKLKDHQLKVCHYLNDHPDLKGMLLYHSLGSGKCHGKDTPILMYDGSIKMVQNIKKGELLMGDDSTPRKVLSLARGTDKMYDIIPVKGDKYTVNQAHILCLKAYGYPTFNHANNKNNTCFSIQYIKNNTFNSKTFAYTDKKSKLIQEKNAKKFHKLIKNEQIIEISVVDYLKLPKTKKALLKGYRVPIKFQEKELPFNPYIIGYWIGDGSSYHSRISCQDSTVLHYLKNTLGKYDLNLNHISNYDYGISGYSGKTGSNKFLNILKDQQLIQNKHIPTIYLYNSRRNRLRLLAGLLDSDGSYDKGMFEFSQSLDHEQIIDDVIYLCRSLGFACYKVKKKTSWTYLGVKKYGWGWRIDISGEGIEKIPTKIKRKQANPIKQKKDVLVTGITVKAKPKDKYYGFTLNGNSRYVLGDFTVTHNTISAITIIRCLLNLKEYKKKKVFMLTPTSLVDNFSKEMNKLRIKFGKNVKIMSHGKFVKKVIDEGTDFCKDSIIVIDEAQNFKTIITGQKGLNAKTMLKATSVAAKVFLLSATPIQNRPEEFTNLYAMITNKEKDIKELYKFFNYNPSDSSNSSSKCQQELKKRLYHRVSYFKNESTEDYPSVTYYNKKFYMTPEYYKAYKKVEADQADIFKIYSNSNLKVFYNGIRRAVNYIDENIPTAKVEWAIEHIKESVKEKKKTLLYSNWLRSGLKIVQEELDNLKIKWVQVNGSMTVNQRNEAVRKYNSGKVKVLFISSAGSLGLDLKGTNSIIILEPHWNQEKIKQVIGRGVRYKSHEGLPKDLQHVDVYTLYLYKPKNNNDDLKSADKYLKNLSSHKEANINIFYKTLIKASI